MEEQKENTEPVSESESVDDEKALLKPKKTKRVFTPEQK